MRIVAAPCNVRLLFTANAPTVLPGAPPTNLAVELTTNGPAKLPLPPIVPALTVVVPG